MQTKLFKKSKSNPGNFYNFVTSLVTQEGDDHVICPFYVFTQILICIAQNDFLDNICLPSLFVRSMSR